jgi:hypothetical protein
MLEYVPTSQSWHVDAPCALKLPIAQGMHSVDPVAGAYVPASHGVHDADPLLFVYVPALHSAHVDVESL